MAGRDTTARWGEGVGCVCGREYGDWVSGMSWRRNGAPDEPARDVDLIFKTTNGGRSRGFVWERGSVVGVYQIIQKGPPACICQTNV